MQDPTSDLAPKPVKLGDIITRSVLEARWSVVLTALGVPWLYEAKCWNLSSGRYLPDFWLPRERVWVEIKPAGIPIDDRRYRDLAAAGETLVLIAGSPWPGDYSATLYTQGRVERNMRLALGRVDHRELWLTRVQDCFSYPLSRSVNRDYLPLFDCYMLNQAFRAARNALFEVVEERA